jgi:hypothetical protein
VHERLAALHELAGPTQGQAQLGPLTLFNARVTLTPAYTFLYFFDGNPETGTQHGVGFKLGAHGLRAIHQLGVVWIEGAAHGGLTEKHPLGCASDAALLNQRLQRR